jgi:hypothetical protein
MNQLCEVEPCQCPVCRAVSATIRQYLSAAGAGDRATLQRRFLDTPGTITSDRGTITVTLSRRAYSSALRNPASPPTPPSPGGQTTEKTRIWRTRQRCDAVTGTPADGWPGCPGPASPRSRPPGPSRLRQADVTALPVPAGRRPRRGLGGRAAPGLSSVKLPRGLHAVFVPWGGTGEQPPVPVRLADGAGQDPPQAGGPAGHGALVEFVEVEQHAPA